MPAWPSTLPQTGLLGTSIGDDDARLITSMDVGPTTMRNRFTSRTQTVDVPMVLTGVQLAAFQTFFRTDLNNGVDTFTWKNPADDSTVTFRFKGVPKWRSVRPGSPNVRLWQSSLMLEIQP